MPGKSPDPKKTIAPDPRERKIDPDPEADTKEMSEKDRKALNEEMLAAFMDNAAGAVILGDIYCVPCIESWDVTLGEVYREWEYPIVSKHSPYAAEDCHGCNTPVRETV